MLKLNLIISCLCFWLGLSAQNIDRAKLSEDGYIEMLISLNDINNNRPIAEKDIRLTNRNTGTTQTTRTDKDGRAVLIEKTGCEYDVYVGKSRTAQSFGLEKMDFKRIQVPLGYDATEENEAAPQDNEVLLVLRILDFKAKTQAGLEFALIDPKTGKTFGLKSDANGLAQCIVPSGATLKVAFAKAAHYTNVQVPNKSHHTYSYDLVLPDAEERAKWQLFPSPNMALFNFEFRDMQGELVANEEFEVGGGGLTEKSVFVRTNDKGFAQLLVPAQGTRAISHSRNANFRSVNTEAKNANDVQVYYILYSSISEVQRKAYDNYLLELETFRDSMNAVAEAERRAFEARLAAELRHADSLEKIAIISRMTAELAKAEPEPIVEEPIIEKPIVEKSKISTTTPSAVVTTTSPSTRTDKVRSKSAGSSSTSIDMTRISNPQHLRRSAEHYRQIMGNDPSIFEREKLTVLAVLTRMDTLWTNKIIVTDVTGSMMPYMNQVLIWHALKNAQNETDAYLFFNDGDNRKTHEKMIGATRGFYPARSEKMDDIYNTMITACLAGNGGDSPENDVEALLYVQKYLKDSDDTRVPRTAELILVADALSPMRDCNLMGKINKPVRVILCGSESAEGVAINVDYLTLAAATGGSIHTIEKDIMDIALTKEDEVITVCGNQYVRKNGAFIPVLKK
jgi:hypothetical protein